MNIRTPALRLEQVRNNEDREDSPKVKLIKRAKSIAKGKEVKTLSRDEREFFSVCLDYHPNFNEEDHLTAMVALFNNKHCTLGDYTHALKNGHCA